MSANILSKITKEPETRTTCTLSQEGSSALDNLMKGFGLTQKQVFDIFITKEGVNKDIIKFASIPESREIQRQVRKSLVITKKNLKILNEASEKTSLQRDVIIDFAFRWLVTLLETASEQQREQHKKALIALREIWGVLEKTEKELGSFLDEDNAILSRFGKVIVVLMNLVHEIEDSINNGTIIDPDGL